MLQHNKKAALYCRVSKEEETIGDSNSITNQELILTQYAKSNDFQIVEIFKDDGFSGTNFERPAFIKMLEYLRTKKADVVIVKDLSRFGREHIQTDLYREIEFPKMGVRLIAITDNYDSAFVNHSTNSMAQIKGLFNEWYAADTSDKVRHTLRKKAEARLYIGKIPYGYKKNRLNHNQLVPNHETASIVQRIFDLAIAGNGYHKIAKILTDDKILCPGEYSGRRRKTTQGLPYEWNFTTVRGIITNKVYLGHSLQCRTTKLSHKIDKSVALAESEWIRVDNTHKPLISQDVWDRAQAACAIRTRSAKARGEPHIFAGLLRCGDCDSRMAKGAKYSFSCQRYKLYGKDTCTSHYISGAKLSAAILANIYMVSDSIRQNRKAFIRQFSDITEQQRKYRITILSKEHDSAKQRFGKLPSLFRAALEEYQNGTLADDMYAEIKSSYKAEREVLRKRIEDLDAAIEKLKNDHAGLNEFVNLIERYSTVTELDSTIVHELIEKIVVYQAQKTGGQKIQKIDVYFRFVGKF